MLIEIPIYLYVETSTPNPNIDRKTKDLLISIAKRNLNGVKLSKDTFPNVDSAFISDSPLREDMGR